MTIDEAIQHCREKVQEQAKKGCYSCAEEHQQLAEWLKELKAYKENTCGDAINRQAVLDGLASIAKAKAKSDAQKSLIGRVMFFTEHLPPVTPQQRTGRWILHPNDIYAHLVCDKCLSCAPYDCKTNYCPNCGAKMESEDKE